MQFPSHAIDRLRRTVLVSLLWDTAQRCSQHRAASKGAALALYMVFSLAPILLLVIAIAGQFFSENAVRDELVNQIAALTGRQGAEAIRMVLSNAQQSDQSWSAALISTVLLIFSSTTAFAELQNSLDELWDAEPGAGNFGGGVWSLVRTRLLSFGLVLVLALFLLMSLAVNAALAALQHYWQSLWADNTFADLVLLASNAFSFCVVAVLFAVVFRMLPSVRLPWRDVIPGALVTALLFVLGKGLIGLYLGRSTVSSSYGVAGSVIALILWIYYSAQIFFFGAAFTRQYSHAFGSGKRSWSQALREMPHDDRHLDPTSGKHG